MSFRVVFSIFVIVSPIWNKVNENILKNQCNCYHYSKTKSKIEQKEIPRGDLPLGICVLKSKTFPWECSVPPQEAAYSEES